MMQTTNRQGNEMIKILLLRIAGIGLISIAVLFGLGLVWGLFNDKSQSLRALLMMPLNIDIVVSNPKGAFSIAAKAVLQLFIVWLFYFIGRKFMKKATNIARKEK
jgi:hypothetical protein